MSAELLTLRLQPRASRQAAAECELTISSDASIDALYAAVAKKTGYPAYQIRITRSNASHLQPAADTTIEDANLFDGSSIFVKDLGPQIGWRTVFLLEYLGPIFIHPLILYVLRPLLYTYLPYPPPPFAGSRAPAATTPPTFTQQTLCAMVILHYIKRELETVFVHRFSASTMPMSNLPRNVAYYWLPGGLLLAYSLYYPTTAETPPWLFYPGLALWVFAELSNCATHLTLRDLRRPGSRDRGIPSGYGFRAVTCPNYSFEVLGWLAVTVVAGGSVAAFAFFAWGLVVQTLWAKKKEARYRAEFGDRYKKKKYVIVPGLI
ncbi:hypothetical protein DRE_01039 [Drechslerella stenobrocha 248]|uniref:3-oxo-5-alpha-steroid 4-dehydrogenase C-terminal domain-containing protein n=1 Tax=Drechslerella stenobrocha 248 TaxID=1043628 RepID=W7I7P6_9PEZI|nr:hypothetical protein DRE_01039 [Drechslerella stenobrocha 248]